MNNKSHLQSSTLMHFLSAQFLMYPSLQKHPTTSTGLHQKKLGPLKRNSQQFYVSNLFKFTYLQRLSQDSSGPPVLLYVEFGGHSTDSHFNFPAETDTATTTKRTNADLILTKPLRLLTYSVRFCFNFAETKNNS